MNAPFIIYYSRYIYLGSFFSFLLLHLFVGRWLERHARWPKVIRTYLHTYSTPHPIFLFRSQLSWVELAGFSNTDILSQLDAFRTFDLYHSPKNTFAVSVPRRNPVLQRSSLTRLQGLKSYLPNSSKIPWTSVWSRITWSHAHKTPHRMSENN